MLLNRFGGSSAAGGEKGVDTFARRYHSVSSTQTNFTVFTVKMKMQIPALVSLALGLNGLANAACGGFDLGVTEPKALGDDMAQCKLHSLTIFSFLSILLSL